MRRTFLFGFLFSIISVSALYAQRGGYGHALAPVGSVGRAPIVAPFGRSFSNLGYGSYGGYGYGGYGHGRRGYGWGIGAYPIFINGFPGDYYQGYTDPTLGAPPAYSAPAAPPVVINQYFSGPGPSEPPSEEQPTTQVYSQPPVQAPAPSAEPRTYLIAYKDHSVYSALAYWIEDHTLNYVTAQNTHNQVDLALVDIDFTKKLNGDKNMSFNAVQH